jgi:hypothetical protein
VCINRDHSVDQLRPVYNFLENMLSGHNCRFYNVIGFTIPEKEVISQDNCVLHASQ